MRTDDFDYHLPERLIAQTPVEPRDASRLLVLHRQNGQIEHRHFRDIGAYLCPGDLLIANESRVIPARLYGRKIGSGGRTELLLIKRLDERHWEALVRGRHVRASSRLGFPDPGQAAPEDQYLLVGEVLEETASGGRLIRFPQPIEPLLDRLGVMPLPPYIHTALADAERYQTVYSRIRGSAAAPTAGLHFTPELLQQLQAQGVDFAFCLLHISLDTFRPVHEENVEDHVIHSEYAELSAETAARINRARAEGRRVIAVGTTSVRVLETAAQHAQPPDTVAPVSDWTRLYIYPGYSFRVVDALITNFHLPRSSLLMLVSAFAGRELALRAYQEAVEQEYRFFSFGDSMLIL
jgi:S-adenosylmethionine:tRNA ribosyltransferase-isomerase